MSALLALAVGVLVGVGLYQAMEADLFRIAFGLYVLFNAVNLLILALGAGLHDRAPAAHGPAAAADPMLQAMVLTAIVIGFGLATFLLLLAARLAAARRTLDAEEIREWRA